MKRKLVYKIIVGTLLLGLMILLCAWSPWVGDSYAQEKAKAAFISAWEHVSDGCGIDCEDCGTKGTNKVLFGRDVTIDYVCGWEGDVITRKSENIFVSFLGNVRYEIKR